MAAMTPETRPPAPGQLRVVQDFINSGHLAGRAEISLETAEAIRARRQAGESQATVASALGIGAKLVAAVARGAPLSDEIATPAAAAKWLVARDLLPPGATIDHDELRKLHEFRAALRRLAQANNGVPLDPAAAEALDRFAAETPLVMQFGADSGATLRAPGEGLEGAIGRLLTVVFDAMRSGTFQRLKRCPGDGCPHTFYDASRNRTGTWCSMSVCGNRTKVRSYQSRRRATRQPTSA